MSLTAGIEGLIGRVADEFAAVRGEIGGASASLIHNRVEWDIRRRDEWTSSDDERCGDGPIPNPPWDQVGVVIPVNRTVRSLRIAFLGEKTTYIQIAAMLSTPPNGVSWDAGYSQQTGRSNRLILLSGFQSREDRMVGHLFTIPPAAGLADRDSLLSLYMRTSNRRNQDAKVSYTWQII